MASSRDYARDFNANVTRDLARHCIGQGFLVAIGSVDFGISVDRIMAYAADRGATRLSEANLTTLHGWVIDRVSRSAEAVIPAWEAAQAVAEYVGEDLSIWSLYLDRDHVRSGS
jgi:hypothetical protein